MSTQSGHSLARSGHRKAVIETSVDDRRVCRLHLVGPLVRSDPPVKARVEVAASADKQRANRAWSKDLLRSPGLRQLCLDDLLRELERTRGLVGRLPIKLIQFPQQRASRRKH